MKQEHSAGFVVVFTVAAIWLNAGMAWLNELLALPFFMDSIGTAVAAAVLPFVPALLVAVLTNFAMEVVFGFPGAAWPFFICSVATMLIVRAFVSTGRFKSVGDALLVSLLVALANAILGGTIAAFVFGGLTTVALDYLVTGLVTAGQSLVTAAFWARVPANLVDKTIAVFAAFFLAVPLARLEHRIRRRRPFRPNAQPVSGDQ